MKPKALIAGLAAVALLATGCVSKKKYARLEERNNALMTEYNTTKLDLAQCQTGLQSVQAMLASAKSDNADLKQAYVAIQKSLDQSINQGGVNISKLVDEINSSNK